MALRRINHCSHSTKNGDKNTAPRQRAHTAPCNGNITNSLAPPTFQNTPVPYLPMARPKYLPPSVQPRSDGIPSALLGVIIRNLHGVATLLLAVPVAIDVASQAGLVIRMDRSVRIGANAFPDVVALPTVVCGFAFKNQMTNSSTGGVHRQKRTWKPRQCLSFTLYLPPIPSRRADR